MSTDLFQELFPWYRTAVDVLVPITFKLTPRLVEMIDEAQSLTGEGRAQFVRNAIAEKLAALDMPVAPEDRLAPSRKGVGGYPRQERAKRRRLELEAAKQIPPAPVALQPVSGETLKLNDAPLPGGAISSDVGRGVVAGADAVAAMVGRSAAPVPSPKAASTTYKKRGQPARTAPRRNSPRSAPAPAPNERGNPT